MKLLAIISAALIFAGASAASTSEPANVLWTGKVPGNGSHKITVTEFKTPSGVHCVLAEDDGYDHGNGSGGYSVSLGLALDCGTAVR